MNGEEVAQAEEGISETAEIELEEESADDIGEEGVSVKTLKNPYKPSQQ